MDYNNNPKDNAELCDKKFSIIQKISNLIVVTNNITSIANLMLDLAIDYTEAETGSFMMVNELGKLQIRAAKGIDIQLFNTFSQSIGEGIAGTVAKQKIPVLVQDINSDERFKEKKRDHYRTGSFISCPILFKNKLLGVLNISDKKDGSVFSKDEFDLMQIISNHAAIVLQNASLMNQLRVKAAGLEELNKRLIEFDIVKSEFLTRVSHELRTPLNSIKGSIYYMNKTLKPNSPELGDFFDIVSSETNKLIEISENLLDYLRLENGSQAVKKTMIDLPELVQEIIDSKNLETTLAKKGVKLTLNVKKDISNVFGDRIRVFQFFINLIEGLCYYLAPNDQITIAFDEDDFVNIHITIPRQLPESIYQNIWNSTYIFQGEHSEEKVKLFLAWKVAEIHKWKLIAENRQDSFHISVAIPQSAKMKIEAVLSTTMDMFTEFISEMLNLNICSIMLTDELTGELSIKSARGLSDDIINRTRIRAADSVSGWVALEGKPLLLDNIENSPDFVRMNASNYNTNSLLSLPLKIDDKVIGVVNLNNKKTGETFTKQDLNIASSLCERISFFLKKLYTGEYSEDYFKRFIASFDNLLSAEKTYFKKNTFFPNLMGKVMNNLNASDEDKSSAMYVSMIYDLGLALVENGFLQFKKLSPSELSALRVHPYTTVGLLDDFEFSADVKKAILHHHERYDGTGYPDGLKGEEIPFISRALSVVDSFCALITEKPYRKACTKDAALAEIRKGSGSLYDPKIVEALEKAMSDAIMPIW